MNFYINQHSTLPMIQMELINNGRVSQREFNHSIQSSDITFCMKDTKTGQVVVPNKPAFCIAVKSTVNPHDEKYLIGYNLSARDTKKAGTYIGYFTLTFENNVLKVPIQEELFIHILDSSIK